MCKVGEAEVEKEDENEDGEVEKGEGQSAGEEYLEDCKGSVEGVDGDLRG